MVRFAPDSDRIADIPDWQLRAKRGLTHRNKKHCYSITSSARVSSVGDSVMPSTFADVWGLLGGAHF